MQVTTRGPQTAADWTALNPVLDQFEIGIEVNPATGAYEKAKLGNGRTAWTSLGYWSPGGSTGMDVYDIRDYGAAVDGVTDDGPAVQAALEAAKLTRGGIIAFPAGTTRIASQVLLDAAANYNGHFILQGVGGASRIAPRSLGNAYCIHVSNANIVEFRDLTVLGASSAGNSTAGYESNYAIFSTDTVSHPKYYNILFAGLAVSVSGVIASTGGVVDIENVIFGGCLGTNRGVVDLYQSPAFSIRNTRFIDFVAFDGTIYSKYALTGNTKSWVYAWGAGTVDGSTTGNAYEMDGVWMDENTTEALVIMAGTAGHTAIIKKCAFATGFGSFPGLKTTTFKKVRVEDSFFGLSLNASEHASGIFTDCEAVELENVLCKYGSKYFTVAGTTKRVKARDFTPQGSATYPIGLNNTANAFIDSDFGMPTTASATALAPLGATTHVTGTTAITSITTTNLKAGDVIKLIFDSTATLTDGNNIKAAGNLVATADDSWTGVFDGTNVYEVARSVN